MKPNLFISTSRVEEQAQQAGRMQIGRAHV